MKRIIATWPSEPRTKDSARAAQIYAGVLAIIVTVWLLGFNHFVVALDSYDLPLSNSGLSAAIYLACLAILALPFLLRMKLSPAMRVASMTAGILTALSWLGLSVWSTIHADQIHYIALLAPVLELPPGWWMIALAVGICVLAAWSSWGLWPFSGSTSLEAAPEK